MATNNVLLFVPNLIGYVRILLMLLSFYFMPFNYKIATWCYVVSDILDAADGYAARYFDQSSKFGAMLDQLTDRCGTAGLCMTLSYFYPNFLFLFQLSIVIDISCHWVFLYTSVLQKKASHKFVDVSWNPILQLYYSNRCTLFFMCMGNEAFYATLYLLHFTEGPLVGGVHFFLVLSYITAPIAVLKSFISLVHGYIAFRNLVAIDTQERKRGLSKK